jgi:hypothetical protein
MYLRSTRLALACILPLCAGCPSLGSATQPKAPIDAEAVAPLWNVVLLRYTDLAKEHVPPPLLDSWLLDAELLQSILDSALNENDDRTQ